jgi:hypothetical protein
MRDHIFNVWKRWDDPTVEAIAAVNFLRDTPASERQEQIATLQEQVGACGAAGPLRPENWLRAQFNLQCANGTVGAFFTLAPTQPPTLQHLEFRRLQSDSEHMGARTGAPAGVSCRP